MRRLATTLAFLALVTMCASAQTSTYCDNGCGIPWTVASVKTIAVTCGSLTYSVNYWFQYRTGCTGEPEFFVLAFEMIPGFNSPPCTVDGVIAAAMQDIVRNPPDGVPSPADGDCADIWRLSTSNCWGRYEREGKHPQMRGRNSACCWARFKVCRRDSVNSLINRIAGGTLNLPGCDSPIDPTAIFECATICSQLWDHFPGDNTGGGSKPGLGGPRSSEREMISSAGFATTGGVRVSFAPERDGRYSVTLFDGLGRTIAAQSADCRRGETATVNLTLRAGSRSTVFYTISGNGEALATGVIAPR